MNNENSQEDVIFSLEGVQYIYFETFSENYYAYYINSVDENGHLIEKNKISNFFIQSTNSFSCIPKILYMTDRFLKFVFIVEQNDVLEVSTDPESLKKELNNTLNREVLKPKEPQENQLKEKWESLYGNSDSSIRHKFDRLKKMFW